MSNIICAEFDYNNAHIVVKLPDIGSIITSSVHDLLETERRIERRAERSTRKEKDEDENYHRTIDDLSFKAETLKLFIIRYIGKILLTDQGLITVTQNNCFYIASLQDERTALIKLVLMIRDVWISVYEIESAGTRRMITYTHLPH